MKAVERLYKMCGSCELHLSRWAFPGHAKYRDWERILQYYNKHKNSSRFKMLSCLSIEPWGPVSHRFIGQQVLFLGFFNTVNMQSGFLPRRDCYILPRGKSSNARQAEILYIKFNKEQGARNVFQWDILDVFKLNLASFYRYVCTRVWVLYTWLEDYI